MAVINRIVSTNGVNYTSKVTTGMRKLQYFQLGQAYENGQLKYQEAYIQGHNYFKHMKATFDNMGKRIKGSTFSEEVVGPEANTRKIHKFGVIA